MPASAPVSVCGPSWAWAPRLLALPLPVPAGGLSAAQAQALLLPYLQRIALLEQQLRLLRSHLPHPPQLPREGPTAWREPHA